MTAAEWQDGVPAWLADAFEQAAGAEQLTPLYPCFSLGLNEDYFGGGSGEHETSFKRTPAQLMRVLDRAVSSGV